MNKKVPVVRCAIYTRKSREEGLDQEFNSLEAQRETAKAYIQIQREKCWETISKHYDDGGFSGGNMNRPALKELMLDIEAGKVDVVIVYKTDRLSRSLADFTDMMRFFDEHDIGLVSATESFDTKTPQGRLNINVMQSFAQYEREVAAERVRDKLALQKAKGLWTGGRVPLGYDLKNKKLVVNLHEAESVHYIFRRYVQLGSIAPLLEDLKRNGYRTKEWISQKGKHYPAKNFAKSSLYRVLNNPVYIGKIQHKAKGKIYDGLHEPIIDEKLWNKVQKILNENSPDKIRVSGNAERPYLLKGMLKNPNGYSMTPSSQRKGKDKLYRYYVSMQSIKKGAGACPVKTVSAPLIEEVVIDRIKGLIANPEWMPRILKKEAGELNMADLRVHFSNFAGMWENLFPDEQARLLRLMVSKIILHPDRIVMEILPVGMVSVLQKIRPDLDVDVEPQTSDYLTLEIPMNLKKRGSRKYIQAPNGKDLISLREPKYDHALIKAVVRAYVWNEQIENGDVAGTEQIARQENLRTNYVQRIIKLVNLSPDITTAILNGRQPHALTLSQIDEIPLCWQEQRERFGFAA